MHVIRKALISLVAAAAVAAAAPSDAATDGRDAVARGLDLFLHAPDRGAPGATLPVHVLAFGFPTVTTLKPLEGAALEAAWDPESLGPKVSAAPPPVRATSDRHGRAQLDVPIPPGPERELRLLVGVRVGDRLRTHALSVQRIAPLQVAIHTPDTRVVPGGAISAWIMVTSAQTGRPSPRRPVELSLLEGGVARHAAVLTTDAAGTAMARVPIPYTEEPAWSWTLRARTVAPPGEASASAALTLTPREETPGTPALTARWDEADVRGGDTVRFTARIRDGSDRPVAGLAVRTWVGPRGTTAPDDKDAWERASTLRRTDAAGEIHGEATAPTTVVQGVGTTLQLVVRATFEGHDLGTRDVLSVENPASFAELMPQAGGVVPGLDQRVLLRVLDARGRPVQAAFTLEGDGLRETAETDAFGEAEVTWRAPVDLGAMRNVGPCAGGVAAAVVVRPVGEVPALSPRREPFELCVPVHREATAMLHAEPLLARVGDPLKIRVRDAAPSPEAPRPARPKGPSAWSAMLRADNNAQSAGLWIDEGERGADLTLPEGAGGIWRIGAASPSAVGPARLAGGGVIVTPRVMPSLSAKIVGGRAAPRGTIDVDVELSDGLGKGLPGTVAAVVIDLHGGGSLGGLASMDTRRGLCRSLGVERSRCDRFVDGDPAFDPLRRAILGARASGPVAPDRDPGKTARDELNAAFGDVLRSLEGAVFEAAESPDLLRDVRRKGPGGAWQFNPELMTLVTAAMEPRPMTPGGEPLALGDLLAIDPQVTFDNVARRITRLKLFRILAAVRTFRRERLLDVDEPALRDPGAMLRRLLRDGTVPESLVIDPWGGTLQFVKTGAAPFPFLTVTRGFELRSPGPDGRLNTADDVRDPFGRVLASGSPYARAVHEDRIVDAKLDMEVGDATVSAWESLFEALTGTALGGVGLTGIGEGGGGRGEGIGLGSVGTIGHGAGRGTSARPTGVAFWSPPRRTDKDGHLRISIPLGDIETTWRAAFVGVPDSATPAATTIDVPVSLPLSVRVDTGAGWIEGDQVDADVTVRNRTASAARAALTFAASGAASLADPRERGRTVDVPPGGVATARVRLRAAGPGRARLEAKVTAPGVAQDAVVHTWDVQPAGELTDKMHAQWVEGAATLGVPLAGRSFRKVGTPRLVMERGFQDALPAALESIDPDRLLSPAAMSDAIEVAARIRRWATAHRGERSPLAARAADIGRRAVGRLLAYREIGRGATLAPAEARARAFAPADVAGDLPAAQGSCPSRGFGRGDALEQLDVEPPPVAGAVEACWDAFVTDTVSAVVDGGDRVELARALLSLAERAHRASAAAAVAARLRAWVGLRSSGGVDLPSHQANDRASRAIVYAALLRAAHIGKGLAPQDRLAAWLGVQRDRHGGYGSSLATRSAVRALLAQNLDEQGASRVVVTAAGARREVAVGPSARVVVPLDPSATQVDVAVAGPGVVARFERPVLRLWSSPPDDAVSPVQVEVSWPARPRAGKTGVVTVQLRHALGRPASLDVRIPLPPGVVLAAPLEGVRQVQGTLAVRADVPAGALPVLLEIPVRFTLAGRITVPEARARVAFEAMPRAIAPARPLRIE